MRKYARAFLLVLVLLPLGCNDGPIFSVVPTLEFIELSPLTVREFEDSMIVRLSFTDGDGDLGPTEEGSNNFSLFVRDERILPDGSRLPDSLAVVPYRLPDLTSDARRPDILGEIELELSPTLIFPRSLQEQDIQYSIYMVDRAGNHSDTILTPLIRVTR